MSKTRAGSGAATSTTSAVERKTGTDWNSSRMNAAPLFVEMIFAAPALASSKARAAAVSVVAATRTPLMDLQNSGSWPETCHSAP